MTTSTGVSTVRSEQFIRTVAGAQHMSHKELPQSLSIRGNDLYVDECKVVDIAREFGTPLFVVSETHLRNNIGAIKRAFQSHWPEGAVRVMPALKACPVIGIRRVLTDAGAGCDVFGPSELEGALRGGVAPSDISLNGSIKDRSIIRRAIDLGIRVVLDSERELILCEEEAADLGKIARVIFRLKPYLAGLDEPSDFAPQFKIRDLSHHIKYGIPISDLPVLCQRVMQSPNIDAVGVHIHMGRHSKKLSVWRELVESYVGLIKQLSDAMDGWIPRFVDFGGGFAAPHDRETRVAVTDYPTPSIDDYAKSMTDTFRTAMHACDLSTDDITIEVEPGRALHNETGIHLTTVRSTKHEHAEEEHRWAEVDTSEVFLAVIGIPSEYPPFDYVVANKADAKPEQTMDIVGCTCNADWLCADVELPLIEPGDVIAFLNTGSYIEPMAANFNALPRPGTVLVNGHQVEFVRRHETIDEVYQRDIIPERLESRQ